ncbi:MAG: M56 family metallopeptidase [Planctomycetia bacterium]|nr:M56 family metallopeptidase [Planctomycetia bacterium]
MTASFLFEALLAVTLQLSVLLPLAVWLEQTIAQERRDRYWYTVHLVALAIIAQALVFPHPRWTSLPSLLSPGELPAWQGVWSWCAPLFLGTVAAGVCFRAVLTILAAAQSWRGSQRATDLAELTHAIRQQFPNSVFAKRKGVVRLANGRTSSHCWRWQRPVIVLSRRAGELPEAYQWIVVRHELAHLDADHPLHVFVQRCVEATLWFHPLVWWTSREADLAREVHCDRAVAEADSTTYLSALLLLADPSGSSAALAFAREDSLFRRRLAECNKKASPSRFGRLALPLLSATAILLAVTAWPPWNPQASARAQWSPWPAWSAAALSICGVAARDYEVDAHRLRRHHP